uniref:Cytochrome P450 3638G6 short isoform n=1 Tax=Maconellicoccus hirsutus TaxID=177089 RepID=A0AAT9UU78_MACHI
MLDFSLECCIPTSTKTHNIMTTTESHILVDFGTILENCVIAVALLLTGITLRYGFIYYKRMRRMMAMLNSFNQVPTKPIIGSIHLFTGNMRERFRKMVALSKQYEFPFVAWLMNVPIVFIGKCDDIQIVLNKSNDRDLQGVFEKIFCEGLIGLHGEQWRKSRRITISAFTPIMLSRYFSVFDEYAALLTKKLEKLCDTDEVFNIANYVFTIHLSSTVRNLAGYEIEPWSNESKQFVDAMTKCFQMEIKRFANPLLFFNVLYEIYLFITGNRKMYEIIHQLPRKIVQNRLAKYSMKGAPQYDGTSPSTNVSNSKLLIDSVLQRHATDVNFKEKNICDELLNLMIGGFESTGLVTSFMLLMLAMHQEAQVNAWFTDVPKIGIMFETSTHRRRYITKLRQSMHMTDKRYKWKISKNSYIWNNVSTKHYVNFLLSPPTHEYTTKTSYSTVIIFSHLNTIV